MGLGCTKLVQVPADHCQHREELGRVWCFLSPGPLCFTEPHPQNTPAASIPLRDSAKIELLLLLEEFLPSRACAGGGVCASWGSLHPQSPSHRTSSPCQWGVTSWGLLPAVPELFIS